MDSHHTETVDPDEPVVDLAILAAGTLVASRYEIERLLGTGGFARVYAAIDRELGQRIAIKILRSERMNSASLTRMRREVTLARELARPTLVRVYDLGQDGDYTFLTMELVEGETLRALLQRGALPVEEIVRLAEPILDALGALHEAGVVHRDLKPANILLTPAGDVKLGDFGLARRWDSGEKVTRTEALVGTLEYVAPEQALGKQVDGRADLYAFGVLLFEMLTTKLPLEAATNLGTVMAHIISAAPDVRTIRKDVPPWLAELIQHLMEKEPGARPQSAAAVLEIIRARRRDLGWRWKRSRARVAVYALALAVAAAVALLAWSRYWSSFDHIESDAARRLRAVDRKGRVLWESGGLVPGYSATLVSADGRTPLVAGVPEAANRMLPIDEAHRLHLYDASTGEEVKEFRLTQAADRFPLVPTFSLGGMLAVDPDHDGREDLLATYTHSPYWPSYSVYVDPRSAKSTPIFIASGHHRLAGMADIDGDGVDELFFAGSNNKMGWFAGIAAVKLVRSGDNGNVSSPWIEASSPDAEYAVSSPRVLLWYVLAPRLNEYRCRLVSVDRAKRLLRFEFRGGEVVELTFDGFAPGPSRLAVAERRAAREEAYRGLREASRASASGANEKALRFARDAHAKADAIGDASLGEWAGINEAILLARARRADEAEGMFAELAGTSAAPAEVCWQAGQAFEASGELERAARLLRRGLDESAGGAYRGRTPAGLLELLLLILSEEGKWSEAEADLARFKAMFPEQHRFVSDFEPYLAWRTGKRIGAIVPPNVGAQEVFSYWSFEAQWAKGVSDPVAFLGEVDAFRKVRPEFPYLYDSLESEILARLGRRVEATALAKKALDDTTAAAKTEMVARAHLELVRQRAASLRANR
jgi:tRNA A-37 threonylcarbamoyl transferase component Bud32/tetratricopeptide (TPR) repeat protein